MVGRLDGSKWSPEQPERLPSGSELAAFLAEQAEFPSSDDRDRSDLPRVSSYYADIAGRRDLRETLHELLAPEFPAGRLHSFLAAVPSPLVAVVTNYDTLLEQAFREAGKAYDLVVYPADCRARDIANSVLWWRHGETEPEAIGTNELDIDLETTSVIFKMHGSVVRGGGEWDNFVITEEDYVEFLSRMTTNTAIPAIFYQYFRERSFLFLGYSMRDWNLRVVLKNLSKHFAHRRQMGGANSTPDEERPPSWSIQRNPSELEKRLWLRRNVNIFDMIVEEFVDRLDQ